VLGAGWAQLYATLDAEPPAGDRHAPVFVPYLTGERTPVLDDQVRAAWDGLDLGHGREDLLRAAVVGVACAIRQAMDALPGPAPELVQVAGGGTTDRRLRRLLADVLGTAIQPLSEPGVSALGAARIAARSAELSLPLHQPTTGRVVEPGPRAAVRQEAYRRYLLTVQRLCREP
jgi:xylulokinase